MNSLTYLARQFDVLASPRTPPSTPALERDSFLSDRHSHPGEADDTSLKRVRTWSTRSLLFPPSDSITSPTAKRSYSSPDGFLTIASLRRSVHGSSTPPSDTPIRSKSNFESVVRRIFFVRVFMLLWDTVHAAWISLVRKTIGGASREPIGPVIMGSEEGAEDKETETETEDEKPILLLEREPPLRPPIPFNYSPPPDIPIVHRSHTDPPSDPSSILSSSLQGSPPGLELPASTASASRSSTPILTARKSPFHLPKTLVLDLDETLIHSTSRPIFASGSSGSGLLGLGGFGRRNKGAGHVVEVVLGGRSTLYHVYKRPFVDYFLRKVSGWYTLVIFTASMQEYADPVIDWLDAGRGILAKRFFRESCTQLPNGSYTKDLSIVEPDLSRVCLVDNSPISYRVNEANGVPIEGWTHDPSDEALLALLPVLDSLRFTGDVRRVLGIRGFS